SPARSAHRDWAAGIFDARRKSRLPSLDVRCEPAIEFHVALGEIADVTEPDAADAARRRKKRRAERIAGAKLQDRARTGAGKCRVLRQHIGDESAMLRDVLIQIAVQEEPERPTQPIARK